MRLTPLTHDECEALSDALDETNAARASFADVVPWNAGWRDDAGRLRAGAIGRTWGACAELTQLWVDPEHRNRGLGRALLMAFEDAARARGCTHAYLETFSFQAPRLYLEAGYGIAARMSGYARGVEKYWMQRELATRPNLHPVFAVLPIEAGPMWVRALEPADLDVLRDDRAGRDVSPFQGWRAQSDPPATAFIRGASPPEAPWRVGEWIRIGVARCDDDTLVGDIGLLREAHDQVQVGIGLVRSAPQGDWERAALAGVLDVLAGPLQVPRVRAICDARDLACVAVFTRLGFVEHARLPVDTRDGPGTALVLVR